LALASGVDLTLLLVGKSYMDKGELNLALKSFKEATDWKLGSGIFEEHIEKIHKDYMLRLFSRYLTPLKSRFFIARKQEEVA